MILEGIKSPADVKKLDAAGLETLATEVRNALIDKLSAHGGHVGPNLGMVEATVALHYVFDSPKDKFVFDVSHQSYAHKMLTGRAEAFTNPSKYDEVSGYSEPLERPHDWFMVGHTSTSVSLALGLAKARDIKGEGGNVVAVIGDGSLSGGEAFEGLDNAGEYGTNLIVVVNDNEMSIAENHGGLYGSLAELRRTGGKAENNYFKALGLDYVYVEEGNDIQALIAAFRSVKDSTHPVAVHIHTLKGKGYKFAEEQKERFHWSMPFYKETGIVKPCGGGESWSEILGQDLMRRIHENPQVVVMHAAVPAGIGFGPERRKVAGKQFIDVGIAEENAVAMASGLAKGGARPIFSTHSTFIQRTYDQLSQDLCVNNNPAVLLITMAGADGMNDTTHLCIFDIPLMSNIPNLVYLAPTCKEEYYRMMDWAVAQTSHPVALRIPNSVVSRPDVEFDGDYSQLNRYKVDHYGSRVAIIGLGDSFATAQQVAELLSKSEIDATLVNPRYATGLDTELLEDFKAGHELVVTIENGVLDGGFGEKIARHYGPSAMKVLCKGLRKEFYDRVSYDELAIRNRITPQLIAEDIIAALEK